MAKTAAQPKAAKPSKPVPKTKAIKKLPKNQKARFDIKQLKTGYQLSKVRYYKVLSIQEEDVDVKDQNGEIHIVTNDIIEKMDSADHYAKEVPMTMSSLNELLETIFDTVFTVCYRKHSKIQSVVQKPNRASLAKSGQNPTKLSQKLIQGQFYTIICHLVKVENNFGRSIVIDLESKTASKSRQIDHKTIEWIVFKNVKYVLKKGAKELDDKEEKKEEPFWDPKKLAIGNWFSEMEYIDVKLNDKGEFVYGDSDDLLMIKISKNIVEEMDCANIYYYEFKVSLEKLVTILKESNSTAFTIGFNSKIYEKDIQQSIINAKERGQFKMNKKLTKEPLLESEETVVGYLSKNDTKVGHSLIVELPKKNQVSVDHRKIKYLILKNAKYTVQ